MTTMPEEVLIGSSLFAVKSDSESWARVVETRGEYISTVLYGMTDNFSETISVRPTLSTGQKADTLLHEILHGIVNRSGLAIKDTKEEEFIAAITPWLLLVIRDNPDLIAYLQNPDQ